MMSDREARRLCARANDTGTGRLKLERGASQGVRLAGREYRAQRLFVANGDRFTARPYDAVRFPRREQAAYRKQSGAGHLCQFFTRKADFDQAIDRPAHFFQ